MNVTIQFTCPQCSHTMNLPSSAEGKQGKCPGCGQVVTISKTVQVPVAPQPAKPELPTQLPEVLPPQTVASAPSTPPALVNPGTVQQAVAPPIPTTAIQVNVQTSRSAHSLGIASLVLGILSLVGCWVPFIGLFLGGLGIVLGGVGLVLAIARSGSGIGFSIAGTAVSLVGVVMGLVFMSMIIGTIETDLVDQLPPQAQPATKPEPQANNESTKPTESVAPTPSEPNKQGPAWIPATTPLQLGDIQIKITSVTVGNVPLWQDIVDQDGTSEDVLLTIWIEITNTSDKKKIDYQGWMSDYASLLDIDASLVDDNDNDYRKIRFSSTLSVKDAETDASIYPGKSIKDAVVFEPPIEGVGYLRLKLAGKAFEENGEFRFQIPADMIKTDEMK